MVAACTGWDDDDDDTGAALVWSDDAAHTPKVEPSRKEENRAMGKRHATDAKASIRGAPLARRKLNDRVLRSFLVGNTAARPLLAGRDDPLVPSLAHRRKKVIRLLWLAVGDVRNVLATLHALDDGRSKHRFALVLNDASPLVLARNAAMLRLAARGRDDAAVKLWCDAFLDADTVDIVARALRDLGGLAHNKNSEEEESSTSCGFLEYADADTARAVRRVAAAWARRLDASTRTEGREGPKTLSGKKLSPGSVITLREARAARTRAMRLPGAVHDRVAHLVKTDATVRRWRDDGVLAADDLVAPCNRLVAPNPTLWDVEDDDDGRTFFFDDDGSDESPEEEDAMADSKATGGLPNNGHRRRDKDGSPSLKFLETTGPFGAFACAPTAAAIYGEWKKLFATLRAVCASSSEKETTSTRLRVTLRCGECASTGGIRAIILDGPPFFDAIDASNVADYVGLWNVLLAARPARSGAFLRTEHALSLASTLRHVYDLEFPFDARGHRCLLAAARLAPGRVQAPTTPTTTTTKEADGATTQSLFEERVVRVDWVRVDDGDEDDALFDDDAARKMQRRSRVFRRLPYAPTREAFATVAAQLLERAAPLPLNVDMLADPRRAVELSYAWPKTTSATVVELLAMCRQHTVAFGVVDALLAHPRVFRARLVRGRALGLLVECAARPSELRFLAPKLRLRRLPRLSWLDCGVLTPVQGRVEDLGAPKAGLFEPALAAVLVKNDAVLAHLERAQGDRLWERDEDTGEVLNAAFDVLARASADQIQILDRLTFHLSSRRLCIAVPDLPWPRAPQETTSATIPRHATWPTFLDKPLREAFAYVLLLDVQTCTILCDPVRLADVLPAGPAAGSSHDHSHGHGRKRKTCCN